MSLALLSPNEQLQKDRWNPSMITPNKAILEDYMVRKGPYYTAYPPPGTWREDFASKDYEEAIVEVLSAQPDLPLQLYVHFPYCKIQCWFCQCYQMVTHNEEAMDNMVDYLIKEMDLLLGVCDRHGLKPNFKEVHLGGGTPSYLPRASFDRLVNKIGTFVDIGNLAEFALEIDPRTVDLQKVEYFSSKGINRISFGIQDFEAKVGKAINREHTEEEITHLLQARNLFKGVNFDLIFGLPMQTRASLSNTLDTVFRLSPDRIAFSTLGYRPDVFKHNAMMREEDLPSLLEKCYMWEDSLPRFLDAGYERVGMDHFAKPDDEITVAKREGRLFRNQMGYSPGRFFDVCAIGPSGMGRYGPYYFGNSYILKDYYSFLDEGKFPIVRGYKLSGDMDLRRDIMNKVMVYYHVDYGHFSEQYRIDFKKYFAREIEELKEFEDIGVLVRKNDSFTVTYFGNLFLRHICMVFDKSDLAYKHNIETGKVIRKHIA